MPSARYWRLSGITTRGGQFLELGQLELWGGGAKLTATLSCDVPPITGTLANLSDADLGTSAKWALCPGLSFVFDCTTATSADTPRFGALGEAEFVESVTLESSSDAANWAFVHLFNRVVYPGTATLSQLVSANPELTNIATWDAINKGSACTLNNANLTALGYWTNGTARSTVSVATGKWYWEISSGGNRYPVTGVCNALANYHKPGNDANAWAWQGLAALKHNNSVAVAYGSAWNDSAHVVGVALDADAGTLELFKNGASMGVMYTGMTGPYYATTGGDTDSGQSSTTANFGASPFAHSPPSGYTPGLGEISTITENLVPGYTTLSPDLITHILPPDFSTYHDPVLVSAGGGHGGTSQISGTVKVTPATPVSRKVRLYREIDGLLVDETWSDPTTGAYTFADINPQFVYTVISYDHTELYRAVIADRLTPEPRL